MLSVRAKLLMPAMLLVRVLVGVPRGSPDRLPVRAASGELRAFHRVFFHFGSVRHPTAMIESGLWIILLESLLALVLLVLIVWWTMPRAKKSSGARADSSPAAPHDPHQPRS